MDCAARACAAVKQAPSPIDPLASLAPRSSRLIGRDLVDGGYAIGTGRGARTRRSWRRSGRRRRGADQVDALLDAGVDVFRLNLSHGELADHLDRLAVVRERSAAAGRPVAVLADLPGPKVRAGEFPDGGAFLVEGATACASCRATALRRGDVVTVEYPELLDDLEPGDRIVLGDGAIVLTVVDVDADGVDTERRHRWPGAGPTGCPPARRAGPLRPARREHDLELAAALEGRSRLSGRLVRPLARRPGRGAGGDRRGDGPLLVAKVETPSAVGGAAGHPRAGRRRDGGPRRPRYLLPARGRAPPPEDASCAPAWRPASR